MYMLDFVSILRNITFPIVAITIVSTLLAADFSKPEPHEEYELLSESDLQKYVEEKNYWGDDAYLLCLNNGEGFDGTWPPTDQQIAILESKKEDLYKLRNNFELMSDKTRNLKYYIYNLKQAAKAKEIRGRLSDYYRQYKGIVLNGEKVICISAATDWARWNYKEERYNDRNYFPDRIPALEETLVSHSGDGLWGAIYHPETRSFSTLKTYR